MAIPEEQDDANGWRKKKKKTPYISFFFFFLSQIFLTFGVLPETWKSFLKRSSVCNFRFHRARCFLWGLFQSTLPGQERCHGWENALGLDLCEGSEATQPPWRRAILNPQTKRWVCHAPHTTTKGWHFGNIRLFKDHLFKNKKDENQQISCSHWGTHSIQLKFNMLHLWNKRHQNTTEISQSPHLKYRWVLYLQIESP